MPELIKTLLNEENAFFFLPFSNMAKETLAGNKGNISLSAFVYSFLPWYWRSAGNQSFFLLYTSLKVKNALL